MSQSQTSCPNIGLKEDPATFSAFPSQMNACHRVRPVHVPKISHQRTYCLQAVHINCPVYKDPSPSRMPKEIQYKTRWLAKRARLLILGGVILAIIVMLITLLSTGWLTIPAGLIDGTPTFTQSTPNPDVETPVVITTRPIDQSPSPTQTQALPTLPSPTITKVDPILALETPIGGEIQFIIHRVAEGETLQIFADQYNTTVDAITAVNHNLIVPLWTHWLVVIPLDLTDVSDLPAFEPYQVEVEGILLRDLAEEVSASLDDMIYYNAVEADHILHHGEWLLIPREKSQP